MPPKRRVTADSIRDTRPRKAFSPTSNRNMKAAEDSNSGTSLTSRTIAHSSAEAIKEDDHANIAIPKEIPLITPDIGQGGDVPSREAIDREDPAVAPPATTEQHSAGRVQGREASSMSFFQGSSNVKIINSNFNEVHGNATIIRFGDGQFTDVQRNLICDYIANLTVLPDINDNLKKHVLTQSIISLPRAKAVFDDYQNKKKSGPCFKGTREALLREMSEWATGPGESRMYVLSGLAGIGKSTVAYTIASRAADLGLLGASIFFSRDEADRKNAEKFFCTIAYQLCVYNETFAKAIGDVLLTERGSAATTKDPQEQLQILILEPLSSLVQSRARPILVVVDALDECDEDDEEAIVMGLSQLVRVLPSFKVILTTRPQLLVNYLFDNHDGHKIFHLQDIEDKVVDSDIRLYLSYCLSQEQVRARLRNSKAEWCASDEDLASLVKSSGRLFIIASTAVLYVLSKTLGDPGARMKKLLSEITQDRTPFNALNHFYSVIVRGAIQVDDDDDDIVECYQIIIGTIMVLQTPLRVGALACFINQKSEKIYGMLRNLQSVILLGNDDVPRIYHKSFPDFLTDQARCKDPRLRIDPRMHHTSIAIRCFEIMDKLLIFNILGLGNLARFMSNEDGLKEERITDRQLQEKIPEQLRYACVYWANHLEVANIEDVDLMNRLEQFADKHMLYWLEVLSLIGKLDWAHRAIRIALKHLKWTASDLCQLLSDALRFISKFYEVIERSALHTYYSALPFTPSTSLLYRRYSKQAADNNVKICGIEGGPEKWDALVANLSHRYYNSVNIVKFSLDSALLVSCSEGNEHDGRGMLKIWDAATGTPISTISGDGFAVANDFSIIASSKDNIITYYNVNGSARGTMFTTSSIIQVLALSESSRVAAALSDGTVWLWESRNAGLIDNFDGFQGRGQLKFSPDGTRLVYSSARGIIKLRDGLSGRFITDLQCSSSANLYIKFSDDGTRIASLSFFDGLRLWNTESGRLIGAVDNIIDDKILLRRDLLAISANGSLLATGDRRQVTLWSGNDDSLVQIAVLELNKPLSIAFSSDNKLAIATSSPSGIQLYDIDTYSFIFIPLLPDMPMALTFSPDCFRLAVGRYNGTVCLCDIQAIDASGPSSKEAIAVVDLALSRDCLRLACGFSDGTVELWDTSCTKRRISSHQGHLNTVSAVGFRPDGEVFASLSHDGTIKLWNGEDGSLCGTLRGPVQLQKVALSNSVLVAAGDGGVALWSLDTQSLVRIFNNSSNKVSTLSIAENSALIAIATDAAADVAYHYDVLVLDAVNYTTIATFEVPSAIHTMTFLPDNSHLVAKLYFGDFLTLDLINKRIIKEPILEHLIQLHNTPFWNDVPIWYYQRDTQGYCSALFSQHRGPVPVLWIPRDLPVRTWTQGSSMIAFGCSDGRVILLRLSTSHFG